MALSSPGPVSTPGLVTRDHVFPFQCSMSTFGDPADPVWPTAQALLAEAAATPVSRPGTL